MNKMNFEKLKNAGVAWEKSIKKSGLSSFEARAQSLQAEIDAITNQRDSFIKAHHIAMNDVCENKAKIGELQKLRSLDEMAINQLAQANQVWRSKCDELQKRIDDLTNINESLVAYKNQLLDAIEGDEND